MPLSLPIFSRWATEGKFARVLEKANRDLDVDHVTSNKGGHHLSETIRKSDKELRKLIANMVQHAVAPRDRAETDGASSWRAGDAPAAFAAGGGLRPGSGSGVMGYGLPFVVVTEK